MSDINKELGLSRDFKKNDDRKKKDQVHKAAIKEMQKEVEAKIKTGGKLTTEDLLAMQTR